MAARSPASSPRLPSPPPMAEDQLGPVSPGLSLFEDHSKFPSTATDTNASRRIRPGTTAAEMAEGPPLIPLQDIDSAFPLTEHLKALHYSHTHPPSSSTTTPITAAIAKELARPPANTTQEIWLYELGRFLIQKTNAIIVALFADAPPCSAQTCPEMRASEWQYLCAVHDPPKSCSAIDYCCHTLDWAATTLTSSKMFPSRLGLGSGQQAGGGMGNDKVLAQQMKEITNIFRRVYRIYAHAWFQHREMFWRVEGKTGLYVFFKTVCDEYGMIQAENYTIPPEAEGLEPAEMEVGRGEQVREEQALPSILKRTDDAEKGPQHDPAGSHVLAAGDTTKRHRHTLSDRGGSVATVIQEEVEEDEEDGQQVSKPEREEQEEEKPSLERQATSLRDFAESLPQPGRNVDVEVQEVPPEEELPASLPRADQQSEEATVQEEEVKEDGEETQQVVGLQRSDTLKPTGQTDGEAEVEETEVGEQTVIELDAQDESMEAPEEKVEVTEPLEAHPAAPAAEGEEAGKSVAD